MGVDVLAAATALLADGDYSRAIPLLESLVDDPEVGPEAEYLLACGRYYSGALQASEAGFLAVLRREHQKANSAYFLGEIALTRQDRGLAVCYFSGALAFDPAHKAAQQRLGEQAIEPGRSASARTTPSRPERPEPSASPTSAEEPRFPPHPPRKTNSKIGVVIEARHSAAPTMAGPASAQRLDIELQTYDHSGQPAGPAYVYLLGVKVTGHVGTSNWIEIAEKPDADGRVRQLMNLTTQTTVVSKSSIFFPGS